MAQSDQEVRNAIARVKNSPDHASDADWKVVNDFARLAGTLGNLAREAIKGR
ncbi:hypothetical protein [Nocardia harenae]|uniref:hypothetical protein n=1 Tax=Nocardia harenae TaxID=358707 RepID=UPI000A6DFEAC|nr:hypothetical protein [Nocardia harenae]